MKLYDERNSKRTINCSYCYNEGHNKRNCPHLKSHFLANKDWSHSKGISEIVGITADHFPHYYHDTSIASCARHFSSHFKYAKGLYGDQASTTPRRPRKKTKCGFCGSKTHTRRNCKPMKQFVNDLEQANKGFRSKVYDNLFQSAGFGIGAFVQQQHQDYHGDLAPEVEQGLVTHIDMGSISIGNLLNRWSDYASHFSFKINGEFPYCYRWGEGCFSMKLGEKHDLPSKYCQQGYGQTISAILAPAPSVPTKEWFLGQSPAFDWVVKKRDLSTLWDVYDRIIKEYHPNGDKVYEKWNKKLRKK